MWLKQPHAGPSRVNVGMVIVSFYFDTYSRVKGPLSAFLSELHVTDPEPDITLIFTDDWLIASCNCTILSQLVRGWLLL